jgi:tetratricopeptide (TPR) repeat protein
MNHRPFLFLAVSLCFLPAELLAERQDAASLYAAANSLYQAGDFVGAEKDYRQLLSRGISGGEVFYNLGNACFKQRKLGEAIYFWEKARRLLPGDTDVWENLELGRSLITDRIDAPEDPLPVRWVSAAVDWFRPAQGSWLALALFVTANLLLGLYLLAGRSRVAAWALAACLGVGVLFVVAGGSVAWNLYEQQHRQQGIIIAQAVELRSGPGDSYMTVATIHEGCEVLLKGQAANWYQVILPNGWTGWLPTKALLVL